MANTAIHSDIDQPQQPREVWLQNDEFVIERSDSARIKVWVETRYPVRDTMLEPEHMAEQFAEKLGRHLSPTELECLILALERRLSK